MTNLPCSPGYGNHQPLAKCMLFLTIAMREMGAEAQLIRTAVLAWRTQSLIGH